jgi:hypothetical protein
MKFETLAPVAGLGMVLVFGQAAIAQSASAQTAGAQPSSLSTAGPDTAAIFSLQGENSSISTQKVTDRFYTNGLSIGVQSGEDAFPALAGIGRTLWGEGHQRVGINISQQIYTPYDTAAVVPPKNDEPYAGVLLVTASAVQDDATTRSAIAVSIGVVGPSALGKQVQDDFHDLISQGHDSGWNSQLHDEPVIGVETSRVWRLPIGTLFGFETDALPGLDATVGNLRSAIDAGINFRIGRGLDADFGAPRIRALSGGEAFKQRDSFGWYVFGGFGGQVVGNDITLNGNTFVNSASVKPETFVGQAQGGLAILAFGTRLTYTQVVQTETFKHEKGGAHEFGVLAMSLRF